MEGRKIKTRKSLMMRVKHLAAFLPLLALACLPAFIPAARAQVPSQVFTGTRPLGMGEAFVAVADDGNAIFWNPAGLARLDGYRLSLARSNLFNLDIMNYYSTFFMRPYFIPAITDYLTFGVDLSALTFGKDDDPLVFRRYQFNFSLATKPFIVLKPLLSLEPLRGLNVGVNAKYLRLTSSLESTPEADASGWGADLGFFYDFKDSPVSAIFRNKKAKIDTSEHVVQPPRDPRAKLKGLDGLAFGLMIHDVGGTELSSLKDEFHRELVRWGLSYRFFERRSFGPFALADPLLAVDFDDRLHMGMEVWLDYSDAAIALRAGMQKPLEAEEEGTTMSFGMALKLNFNERNFSSFSVDYATIDNPNLPATTENVSGTLVFRNDPRIVRVPGAHVDDVYASLYRHYNRPGARLGALKLENVSERDTVKAWAAFAKGDYLQEQSVDTVTVHVPPGQTVDLPIRAVFDDAIFHSTKTKLSGTLKVKYEYRRQQYETDAAINYALYGKNYLKWDDPAKAAAFVTDDSVVVSFVDLSLKKAPVTGEAEWLSRYGLSEAVTLYRALQAHGVNYQQDPVTPFTDFADTVSAARYRLDTIQYPGELLRRATKAGDCDDLSVLYASLLQQAGINAALVSGRGHIFMMFDTGIPAGQRLSLPFPPDLFYWKDKETLWLPVETTLIEKSSFREAWQEGARQMFADTTLKVIAVAAAQKKYPPVKILMAALRDVPDFSAGRQAEVAALQTLKVKYLKVLEQDSLSPGALNAIADAGLRKRIETRLRNRYGVALAENDDLPRAKEQFQMLADADAWNAVARNNWGNVEFMQGNYSRAESLYTVAQQLNLLIPETYFNLALLFQARLEESPRDSVSYQARIDSLLWQAAQLLQGDRDAAYMILGMTPVEEGLKAAPSRPPARKEAGWLAKIRRRIDLAFARFVREKIDAKATKTFGVMRGYVPRGAVLSWSF